VLSAEKEYVDEDDLEICSDVIALFPNIMSRNSGKIVRKTVRRVPYSLRDLTGSMGTGTL
jgi:hypothetical protein